MTMCNEDENFEYITGECSCENWNEIFQKYKSDGLVLVKAAPTYMELPSRI
nr:MAG TPA: hypothetical protein [Caudoviricetes sp.]